MTNDEKNQSQIFSDESWKQQAKHEKEKLSQNQNQNQNQNQKTFTSDPEKSPPQGPLPSADFSTLINSLLVQVFFCLGRISDPNGKKPQVNLELAKHHIEMLEVLEEKTKGNLNDEETKTLALALHEARLQFVQTAGV